MELSKKFKVLVSVLVVITVIFSTSTYADGQQGESNKPPMASSVKVNFDDIETLNQNVRMNLGEVSIVTDTQVQDNIKKHITINSELIKFTGLNKNELSQSLSRIIYLGKSQELYSTYLVTFEATDNSWTIISTYDADRDTIIDSMDFKHPENGLWTIHSRNIGIVFEGTKADVELLQKGDRHDRIRLQSDFLKKYSLDSKADSDDEFTISLDCKASGSTCSWLSVPYCAVAGLAGAWPGLICSAAMTLVCNNCD
ncbi:hypothetical protein [Paenibacillus alvei]|uniref:Uncharacterized protein n=1 Tax=Paenibacillus alvei TaxID=44250 RepID=A0AAP7A042_PAEAL|nr:hypothetical protein [Paenibacillus alvei]MBG9735274.1 hypothetical protein [Paenibacillus alvei]MBG9743731.1 hypothetical protein [Paenibacillus alvei]MCY9580161.1 hypothetical protein [Paenibacillus alvei]MCY9584336.1 hypothetical protein [Paenibacillus alvei]NOJ71984.1 hypothetical protein [Paenibacillus alvei]